MTHRPFLSSHSFPGAAWGNSVPLQQPAKAQAVRGVTHCTSVVCGYSLLIAPVWVLLAELQRSIAHKSEGTCVQFGHESMKRQILVIDREAFNTIYVKRKSGGPLMCIRR
jgi:hypothetical protein